MGQMYSGEAVSRRVLATFCPALSTPPLLCLPRVYLAPYPAVTPTRSSHYPALASLCATSTHTEHTTQTSFPPSSPHMPHRHPSDHALPIYFSLHDSLPHRQGCIGRSALQKIQARSAGPSVCRLKFSQCASSVTYSSLILVLVLTAEQFSGLLIPARYDALASCSKCLCPSFFCAAT